MLTFKEQLRVGRAPVGAPASYQSELGRVDPRGSARCPQDYPGLDPAPTGGVVGQPS